MADSIPDEPRGEEAAVYWFACLVTALSRGDYALANTSRKELLKLGFVVHHRPRHARGGAR